MTIVQPNQTFQAVVSIENKGNTTWTTAAGYTLVLQSADVWGVTSVPLPYDVPPNTTVTFTFNVTAPATAGIYPFNWGIAKDGVTFGIYCAQSIQVGNVVIPPSLTPTRTPAGTKNLTVTLTPTRTPAATRVVNSPTPTPTISLTPSPTKRATIPSSPTPTPTNYKTPFLGMIAWYKFEQNLLDSSGHNYHLSPITSGNVPTYVNGKFNYAADFSSSTGAFNDSFPFIPEITVAAWVKSKSTGAYNASVDNANSGFRSIFKYTVNGVVDYDFGMNANSYAYCIVGGNTSGTGNLWTMINDNPNAGSRTVLNDGNWHYINWQVKATDPTNVSLQYRVDGSGWVSLGHNISISPNYISNALHNIQTGINSFNGIVDEIIVWGRLLTIDELNTVGTNPTIIPFETPTPTPTKNLPPSQTPTKSPTPTPTKPASGGGGIGGGGIGGGGTSVQKTQGFTAVGTTTWTPNSKFDSSKPIIGVVYGGGGGGGGNFWGVASHTTGNWVGDLVPLTYVWGPGGGGGGMSEYNNIKISQSQSLSITVGGGGGGASGTTQAGTGGDSTITWNGNTIKGVGGGGARGADGYGSDNKVVLTFAGQPGGGGGASGYAAPDGTIHTGSNGGNSTYNNAGGVSQRNGGGGNTLPQLPSSTRGAGGLGGGYGNSNGASAGANTGGGGQGAWLDLFDINKNSSGGNGGSGYAQIWWWEFP